MQGVGREPRRAAVRGQAARRDFLDAPTRPPQHPAIARGLPPSASSRRYSVSERVLSNVSDRSPREKKNHPPRRRALERACTPRCTIPKIWILARRFFSAGARSTSSWICATGESCSSSSTRASSTARRRARRASWPRCSPRFSTSTTTAPSRGADMYIRDKILESASLAPGKRVRVVRVSLTRRIGRRADDRIG